MNQAASGGVSTAARREAVQVMLLWVIMCVYTTGFAGLFAYRSNETPILFMGIPAWVIGGVLFPWLVCLVLTCWFAWRGIQDEDLGEESPQAELDASRRTAPERADG